MSAKMVCSDVPAGQARLWEFMDEGVSGRPATAAGDVALPDDALMSNDRTTGEEKAGHRQRLRERFLAGSEETLTDEALLELVLCYAIPQRDVQPLARRLIATFGSLDGVLSADRETLARERGLGANSAVLLELINHIRTRAEALDQVLPRVSGAELVPTLDKSTVRGLPEPPKQTETNVVSRNLVTVEGGSLA